MASYLITNITIFLSCLLTVSILKNAPARPKFYLYMISITSWLVPWSAVFTCFKTIFVNERFQNERLLDINIYSLDYLLISIEYYIQNITSLTFSDLVVAVMVMITAGVLWFLVDVIKSMNFHNFRLKNSTTIKNNDNIIVDNPKNVDIRVGNFNSPGAITGFLTPKIWIDNSVNCPEKLKLILLHELKHIQQNDHLWMWWLAVMQRLMWWNPIVHYAIKQCKLELELSCDEQCDLELPEKSYALGLANILISQTNRTNEQAFTLLNIKHSNKFNVKRIEKLMINCRLQSWHLATCFIGLFMCLSSVFTIAIATPMSVSSLDKSQNYLLKITAENNHKSSCKGVAN